MFRESVTALDTEHDVPARTGWVLLIAVLVLALGVRLYGLSFGIGYHPDERHIIMTTERLTWDDPNPKTFAYGSFPFYLLKGTAWLAGVFDSSLRQYDGLFLVGRHLSAVAGTATCLLLYLLIVTLTRHRGAALFGAALLALNPFHVQLSHFYAVDVLLAFFNLGALLWIVRYATSQRTRELLIAAAFFGLSLATKISALSLFVPLACVLIPGLFGGAVRRSVGHGALFAIVGIVMCVIAAPYQLLDFRTFVAHNLEQIRMVKGEWMPPYTVQYAGTVPYLYHLEQMWWYTMGPVGTLLCGLGLIVTAASLRHDRTPGVIAVFAWTVATIVAVAGSYVKFPRYLIPVYPTLFCLGAIAIFFLSQQIGSIRRLLARGFMALCLLAGLFHTAASLSIYSYPHAYQSASDWIFKNIPAGAKILGVHWDDKLPISLPGFDARQYDMWNQDSELPIYEQDSMQKLLQMAERLSASDYLVLPTGRIPGSILRMPHLGEEGEVLRYPGGREGYSHSIAFLRLLFGGKLGYEAVHGVKVNPHVAGLTWADDLADESISVYDHPRVWIFKNVHKLAAPEIVNRTLRPQQFGGLPGYREIMTGSGVSLTQSSRDGVPVLVQVFLWLAAIEVLAWCVAPWIAAWCDHRPAVIGCFSRAFAVLTFGAISWIGVGIGAWSGSPAGLLVLLGVMVAITWAMYGAEACRRASLGKLGTFLYAGGFVMFLLARYLNPEIFWGEKPMDFSFLNFFVRNTEYPPQDPWFAGHAMNYYYFGFVLYSVLVKVTGVLPSVGYNLAVATTGGLLLSVLAGMLLILGCRRWVAVIGALVIGCGANLSVYWLLSEGRTLSFDGTFWPSSRVFVANAINEYPVWSLLFADLHPHMMALPFTVLYAAFLALFTLGETTFGTSTYWRRVGVLSLLFAALYELNSWDFISYGLLSSACVVVAAFRRPLFGLMRGLLESARDFIPIALGAFLLISPSLMTVKEKGEIGWGWVNPEEFNTLKAHFLVSGHWFVVLVSTGLLYLSGWTPHTKTTLRRWIWVVGLFVAPAVVCLFFPHGGSILSRPWDVMVLCGALLGAAAYLLRIDEEYEVPIFPALLLVGGAILMGAELFFLIDHANTVFKFHNAVWILLGLASFALVERVLRHREAMYRWTSLAIVAVVSAATLVGGALHAYAAISMKRVATERPALDGQHYLTLSNPDEYALVRWIHRYVPGTPVLLEAQGQSYGSFTRICMHTGLPTVLGWEHHVKQRGASPLGVFTRRGDIARMYGEADPEIASQLMQQYGVELIVVGELERETYGEEGLRKFDSSPGHFALLFRSGKASLYATRYSSLHPNFGKRWDNPRAE